MQKDTDIIKEKLDIVEFLRSYITLLPAGKNFKALCPFHQEKTPSFIVSPERQTWHCFGSCGEGGDVIQFVMKYENLEFLEALRFLAEKAGVTLKTSNIREEREFFILYELHEVAKNFFHERLLQNEEVKAYLTERGLSEETVNEFELGFSPGGEELALYLLRLKYNIMDIVKAGLVYKNKDGLYRDRFDGRIMFPITNAIGKTVAFTARVFRGKEDDAKYINSPESAIFNKSKILYGFHKAKSEIAHSRSVVIVEGQMDFLLSWQVGIKNVVAVSGTGLTEQHVERLRRLCDIAIVSFDNDRAGVRALERGLDTLGAYDFYVKVLDLKKYKDPADAAKDEPEFLKAAIKDAQPAFDYLFALYFKSIEKSGDLAMKKRVLRHLLKKIANVKSPVERDEWIKNLSRRSGVIEETLRAELLNLSKVEKENSKETEEKKENAPEERIDRIARRVIALAFTNPQFWDIILENKEYFPIFYASIIENPQGDSNTLLEMYSSYIAGSSDEKTLRDELTELVRQLQIEFFKKQQVELKKKIYDAQKLGDENAVVSAVEAFQKLSKKMNDFTL